MKGNITTIICLGLIVDLFIRDSDSVFAGVVLWAINTARSFIH